MMVSILIFVWCMPYIFQLVKERKFDPKYRMNGVEPLFMVLFGWFLWLLFGLRSLDRYIKRQSKY